MGFYLLEPNWDQYFNKNFWERMKVPLSEGCAFGFLSKEVLPPLYLSRRLNTQGTEATVFG